MGLTKRDLIAIEFMKHGLETNPRADRRVNARFAVDFAEYLITELGRPRTESDAIAEFGMEVRKDHDRTVVR